MHRNNFDFLRILFAVLVIISHSYDLSTPENQTTSILHPVINTISLSYWGVRGFFVISGYLVLQSLIRSNSVISFLWKRIVRIFPGLILILICTLLLLPFFYTSPIPYWKNSEVLSYFPSNLSLFKLQYSIEGIFENNPYPKIINGSLWTLRYEFFFYLLLSPLFFLKMNIKLVRIILIFSYILSYILYFYFSSSNSSYLNIKLHFTDLSLFFLAGCIFATFNVSVTINSKLYILLITLIILISFISKEIVDYLKYVYYPVLIILFANMYMKPLEYIPLKFGDLSYGIYLSAFLIQQSILSTFSISPINLMFATIFISSIYGFLSWNFIEKRALSFKYLF
ncbi:acyltransferase [Apibacter sp. HY039]|uniref:acyltransferase family protein n=1 Tax=Apibacter sp. HY039 TaxID=2501476 RepID=UPI000FEBE682|nr:acyltransferase [Apibacter sp. HY039]